MVFYRKYFSSAQNAEPPSFPRRREPKFYV
jgi:hypothetical protein